jgi:hypothetical protein
MGDLYRTVKRLPTNELKAQGFRNDKLKEGFYKRVSKDRSVVFHVSGMWSYVEISAGVRFDAINDLLYNAAVEAGWSEERAQIFKLELVAMFWEKVDHFCAVKEDLNVYCPPHATIASAGEICHRVSAEANRLSLLTTAVEAVEYMRERSLYEPFGRYMIPATAKLNGDLKLWEWSTTHFVDAVGSEDRPHFLALLKALERG